MKTIVLSDLHLTRRFQQERFNFLVHLLSNSSRVIINGDLSSDYAVTFDQLMNSEWRQLFPVLKNKGCVYIFGNHDKENWSDQRRSQFAVK